MVTWIKNHLTNPLVQNTYLLMGMRILSTVFSFLFWVLAARTIAVDNVGIASGSVSTAMVLAGFAHLGLGYGLVRRLAHTDNPNALINFSILTASLVGLVLTIIFFLGINLWSPGLLPLLSSFYTISLFSLLVFSFTLSRIVFYIFLATRRMVFGLIKQMVQSILGVVLLLLLRSIMPGYISALAAYTLAILLSLVLAFSFLSIVQPGYVFSFSSNLTEFSSFTKYSLVNYLLDQTQSLPTALLPLFVLNTLGASASAYFYIPWSIGRGLVSLVGSVSETLFSEGSKDPEKASNYTLKSTKLAFFLTLGMMVGMIVAGRLVLSVYGKIYVENGLWLLYIVTVTIFPEVLILIIASYFRIRDKLSSVFIILVASSILGITLSWSGMSQYGIIGAGLGWLISQVLVLIFVFVWQQIRRYKAKAHQSKL